MFLKRFCFSILFFSGCVMNAAAQQLVLPGDHPDPSVVKIGDTYWASATSSNWLPAFPLLKSKDLVHWQQQGAVFTTKPAWADFYFWAPEITYDNGKVYVYYAAHKKDGNLCVAVASADKPEGPYTDLGPLVCQPDGSIDAFPMRDEKGKLWLIWKEDGNSVKQPTPIWASEMNESRTALIGEKKELFRNDQSWEKNLVEGVSMIRHGEYFYAFYAAAGCCGAKCNYITGVARSKSLLGPWEKYAQNPVLTNTDNWNCLGHGTAVEKEGKFYLLYHGYDKQSNVFTGRQGLLQEFRFNKDGWIEFISNPALPDVKAQNIKEEFAQKKLGDGWEWSVFQNVKTKLSGGKLCLNAAPGLPGAFVAQKTTSGNYEASTVIDLKKSTAAAGIAAIGDEKNFIAAVLQHDSLKLTQVKKGVVTEIASTRLQPKKQLQLRIHVKDGKNISFSYSTDQKNFKQLNTTAVDGTFLPPWDRAVRVGLLSVGVEGSKAVFENFSMNVF